MRWNNCITSIVLAAAFASAPVPLAAASFGKVVAIGGEASDIALDETRGQLYIADFTGNRIDVMSTADNTIHTSMNVPGQPGSIALSPDARYLVVTAYGNWTVAPPPSLNAITVINLVTGGRQTFYTGDPPLAVAFFLTAQGAYEALVVTTTSFYALDPATGYLQFLTSLDNLSLTMPDKVPLATFPSQILRTAMTTAADGVHVWGIGSASKPNVAMPIWRFDGATGEFLLDVWMTTPATLPRVSPNADGSWAMIGWAQWTPDPCRVGGLMIQSRQADATDGGSVPGSNVTGLNVTGYAVDSKLGPYGTVYGQIFNINQPTSPPYTSAPLPTLSIMDGDNLTVRDQLYIPESLVGHALLNAAGTVMYAISDSGVTVFPVGTLNKYSRLVSSKEDVLVSSNFCNRGALTQTFVLSDPGGNHTDFTISSSMLGVNISPLMGTTPATITVTVQPGAFQNSYGTVVVPLTIVSNAAVNKAPSVRVLVSNPDMSQRGFIVNVPGLLTDILADTARNRFYIVRQDKNQVLVFDGTSNQQLATLRTGNTPTRATFSADKKYLIIGNWNSQLMQVYDLDSWQRQDPIVVPGGHFPRSPAQSNNAMMALVEDDTCNPQKASVDRINFPNRCGFSPASLGVFTNDCNVNKLASTTMLAPSPSQSTIMLASPDGFTMLYDAQQDSWTISRQDFKTLSGAYAAADAPSPATGSVPFGSTDQGTYVIGDYILNPSLVPIGTMDTSLGHTMGYTFPGQGSQQGYRVTAIGATGPGAIQNLPTPLAGANLKTIQTLEAPIFTSTIDPFTRTVAALPSAGNVAVLGISGYTLLSSGYDTSVAPPTISALVNAADGSAGVAPGGLISIYGNNMAATNVATSTIPLPTALGESCLVINGTLVPLLFVSKNQINGQLPFNVGGGGTLTIHTPGGTSDNFFFSILPNAPSVFLNGTAGPQTGLATIIRADDSQLITPSNPIHYGDTIVIYLTGLGATNPAVDSGVASPSSPLAIAQVLPTVTLGGTALNILYAGLVPGSVGLNQINATVPSGVTQGMNIPLVITQGGFSDTLYVRVVK